MPEKTPTSEKVREGVQNKREAIIEAAREIFSRQGYETTTIAEIARTAGVAVGTVYLYFHNKREIYVAISLDWSDGMANALLKPEILALPVEQAPRALIETAFELSRKNTQFMGLSQVDLQTPSEIELYRQSKQRIEQALNIFLLRCVERGDFQPFDTEMYAKIFFELVHSVLYVCFCMENGEDEERYRERTIEIVERTLFGPPLRG